MSGPTITDKTTKTKLRTIKIEPVTRLEGHAKISIFLDDKGNVEDAYFQVVELRGFEEFCKGRPVEELARITTRLCGVCPWAHHMASSKALDAVFHVEPPSAAKKLRELGYAAHMLHSHIAHIYALAAGPDFIVGPAAEPAKRNVFGVIEAVGLDIGKEVIKHRSFAQKIQTIVGGKATHPVYGLPGGVSKPISKEEREEIRKMADSLVEFGKFTLKVVDKYVLQNKAYLDIILNKDLYYHETYYMGVVDGNNKVNFYEGDVRVVDPKGKECARFKAPDYLKYIAEHVSEWSFLKFPFLKKIGWKGLVDGPESGVVRVAPLARLNAADGMATPGAQEAYEKFFATLGGRPVHNTLAFHWARAVEVLYAAERLAELIRDPEVTDKHVRNIPAEKPTEGVGVVEAPRGTLVHHYVTDENGMVEKVNLIVATGINNAGMCMSVKKVAKALIKNGEISSGLLNMVEMAFRAYDPCFACATHALPGQMPMEVNIFNSDKELIKTLSRE